MPENNLESPIPVVGTPAAAPIAPDQVDQSETITPPGASTPVVDTKVEEAAVTPAPDAEVVAPPLAEDKGLDFSADAGDSSFVDKVSEAKEKAAEEATASDEPVAAAPGDPEALAEEPAPAIEAPAPIELPVAEEQADPIVLADESSVTPPAEIEPLPEPIVTEVPADAFVPPATPVIEPPVAPSVPTEEKYNVKPIKDANGMVIRWEVTVTFTQA